VSIEWITAERDSASDDGLLISQCMVADESDVNQGTVLFEVEGSKSLFEIQSPAQGRVYFFVSEGDFIPIGEHIACVCTAGEPRPTKPERPSEVPDSSELASTRSRFSDAAWEKLLTLGLDPESVRPELDFVTAADIAESAVRERGAPLETPEGVLRIALLGGSHGAVLAHDASLTSTDRSIVGVFDDGNNLLSSEGVPLLGNLSTDFLMSYEAGDFDACLITVQADMPTRVRLHEQCLEARIPLATVTHARASISPSATLGAGCLILDGSRVGPKAILKDNIFVSGSVNIDHDCHIGPNTTFGPGVYLSGGVTVGSNCNFGTLIGVESHIRIGSGSTVTSGSVLQHDVPDNSVVKVANQTVVRSRR